MNNRTSSSCASARKNGFVCGLLWAVVGIAMVLTSVASPAQRHRGYTPNGGWHHRGSPPKTSRHADTHNQKPPKARVAPAPTPPPNPPKS